MKCGICLVFTSLKEGDYFINTQCGHIFHYECIRDWISQTSKSSNTCPTCRCEVTLKSVVKLHGISTAEFNTRRTLLNFKFVIIGDSGTGKTCLLNRFAKGLFLENQDSTLGCDLYFKNIELSGKVISLSIWDCGGQDRFGAITPNYMRNANGVFLVYDITRPETMDNLHKWIKLIHDYAPSDAAVIVCGNKSDLPESRQISLETGQELAQQLGINFFETSAKEAHNVEAAFRTLAAQILERMHRAGVTDGVFDLSDDSVLRNANLRERSRSRKCAC